MNEINGKMEQLETKHIEMEQFHTQINLDNFYMRKKLDSLKENEKNLENLLSLAFDRFAPTIVMKKEVSFTEKSSISKSENNNFKELNSIFISKIFAKF